MRGGVTIPGGSIMAAITRQHREQLGGGIVCVAIPILAVGLWLIFDFDLSGQIIIRTIKFPIFIILGVPLFVIFVTGMAMTISGFKKLQSVASNPPLRKLEQYGEPLEIVKAIEDEMLDTTSVVGFGRELKSFQIRTGTEGISGPAYVTHNWLVCFQPMQFLRLCDIVEVDDVKQVSRIADVTVTVYFVKVRDCWSNELHWTGKEEDRHDLMQELNVRKQACTK